MLSTYYSIHLNNNLFNNKRVAIYQLQPFFYIHHNTHSQCVSTTQNSPYPHPTFKQPMPKKTDTHSQCVFHNKKLHYFNISSILSHNSPNSFSSNLRVSITMRPFLSINTLRVIPADECAYLQKASLATSYANG